MHIKTTSGNTIASSSSFSNYKYPAELPTCEWAGSEIRSFQNYVRPIQLLFQNDKHLQSDIKTAFKGLTNGDNVKVSGCHLSVQGGSYVEVGVGSFLYGGDLYGIYPEIKLTQEALNAALAMANITIDGMLSSNYHAELEYDGGFSGKIVNNITGNTYYETSDQSSGYALLTQLNSGCENFISVSGVGITNIAPLPLIGIADGNVRFDSEGFHIDNLTTGCVFGSVSGTTATDSTTYFKMNGDKLEDSSIANAKLANSSITIGSTNIALGSTVSNITNATINGVSTYTNNDNLIISNGMISAAFPQSVLVKSAAGHESTNTLTPTTDTNTIPTSGAVRGYIASGDIQMQGIYISGNSEFALDSISAGPPAGKVAISDRGLITVNNSTRATLTAGSATYSAEAVSDTLSGVQGALVVSGGIVSKDSIFAAGDVLGRNVSSVSSREVKDVIGPFTESALDIINGVDVVNFTYKNDPGKQHKIGIIAEDTHEYIATKKHNQLDHANAIGLLLKAVQELSERCDSLEKRVKELEEK